ncbi:MAG: tRNA (adenosine(37)-N6)-threonylcarbamoyltransferase complex ATPase subunit type 1 TsaE [Alphaproteobacteria bacterium]|nr:tRNA (adenosine(37)-N6)-threonylcarbamoyltransferase complex ATPase subunit type 1 TsaE [Alphaproteobacteria bacterium]
MQTLLTLTLADEAATRRLGGRLALVLAAGDVLALEGDLGAGKTTLARGLIQAALGRDEPVPSPTFTLVQTYEPADGPAIWHFDLYRLGGPDELLELGWDEALAAGVALVEWPERAGDALPSATLWLRLEEAGAGRRAVFEAEDERWRERLSGRLVA